MRTRGAFITLLGGPIAAFAGLFVCCCGTELSAGTIECLTAPNRSEAGWWSWREIDGRKCWYNKVGAVPPKSEFFWPEQAKEAPPAEERGEQEPVPMAATEPTKATMH